MNWQKNFKTKEEAKLHIIDCLMQNPNAVDYKSNSTRIFFFGSWILIKPVKKKKDEKN